MNNEEILLNNSLKKVEIEQKKLELKSTPSYITIGAHYGCNAKCVFCLGGNYREIYGNYISPFSVNSSFEKIPFNYIYKKAVITPFDDYFFDDFQINHIHIQWLLLSNLLNHFYQ